MQAVATTCNRKLCRTPYGMPTASYPLSVNSDGGWGNKPSVTFIWRVVHSRMPKVVTERWQPQGRFRNKALRECLGELPSGGVQGLIFTIEGPGISMVERIPHDDEDGFESMKRYINRVINCWLRRLRGPRIGDADGRLVFDIFVERMSEDSEDGPSGLENLELSW